MGSALCNSKASTVTEQSICSSRISSIFPETSNQVISFDDEFISDSINILELSLKCQDLLTDNRFALLNPVIYIFLESDPEYIKKAETEIIMKTLNPIFTTKIKFLYSLRCNKKVKFEVYDYQIATKSKELIGSIITSIHEIVKAGSLTKEIIKKTKKVGNIFVSSAELTYLNDIVKMNWRFITHKKYGNCILRIQSEEDKQKFTIHQTESQNYPYSNKYLGWEEIAISVNKLCKGEENKKLLFEIVSIGESEFSVFSTRLTLKEIKSDEKTKNDVVEDESERLVLNDFKIVNQSSFIDFVQSGLSLNTIYGIDFSASHGHENVDSSIYLKLINGVHKNLQCYSNEPSLVVFGVGGTFTDSSETSDFFAVSGNIFRPNILKSSMLAECYKTTLSNITPSNISNFSQFFYSLYQQFTYESFDSITYQVLIFFCGQDVSDSLQFKDSLMKFESLPVSILIISTNSSLTIDSRVSSIVKELQISSHRPFIVFDYYKNIFISLENIQAHVLAYSKNHSFIFKSKQVYKSSRSQTISTKLVTERLKSSTNYFSKCKELTIQKLKDLEYSKEKIFEIELKGLPYFIHDMKEENLLPSLNFQSSSRFNRQKSLKAICSNCRRVVIKFSQVPCGCINICENCASSYNCEKSIH